jgi:hypothetical protein
MNIRHLAIALCILALGGCVANNPAQMEGPPKYHALPWMQIEVLGEARPPADLRTRAIWVDPQPMPSLSKSARDALSKAGFRVVDRQEDSATTLRFDGYYRVLSGDRRRQGNLRLEELAQGMEVRWRGNEPGVASHTLDRVAEQTMFGNVTSPSDLLVAVTLGAAFEGIAQAAGVRQAISTEAGVGRGPLFCDTEQTCERANLQARYGYQQFVLALDRYDQHGKERATVRVNGIAEGMIPDRMMTQAASRLLAMYIR